MMTKQNPAKPSRQWGIDPYLLFAFGSLLILGLIMVTSSSIVVAQKWFGDPFHYTTLQAIRIALGFVCAFVVFKIPIQRWRPFAMPFLGVTFGLLILVLIPGLGKEVNGSTRWLSLGPVSFQVSELAKLSFILYLSAYLVRFKTQVQTTAWGLVKPLLLLALFAGLLLAEPDFGAVVVISGTALAMLFLGGAPLGLFLGGLSLVGIVLAVIMVSAPYRLERLTSFLDPWANQFDSGYQLTQALIAFGRGEWFGVGLGSSIQKLFYLPEAHTDFVFAILAEELGFVGALGVLLLFGLFILRAFQIGLKAHQRGERFGGFVCYGVSLWIGLQALINIGVNLGILPTKGLTLPFISYGGSSIIGMCIAVGFLFRVDFENRCQHPRGLKWK